MYTTIEGLERKGNKNFNFIQKFIEKLNDAKENAQTTKDTTKEQLARLNKVVSNCDLVIKFSDKLLKNL